MVYVTEGKIFPGHRPRTGSNYEREKTKFRLGALPTVVTPQAQVEKDRYHLIVCAACPWVSYSSNNYLYVEKSSLSLYIYI